MVMFGLTLLALLVPRWTEGASSGILPTSTIEVRSGRELAVAFAFAARFDTAIVCADVWMLEADWHGLLDGSEPALISRNFTLMGSPSLPQWPLLNLGFVRGKIRIGNGVTLTVRHLVVSDFRSDLLTQAPGFDLATNTTPGGPSGLLLHNETAVTYSVCLPPDIWSEGLRTSTRAASRPGTQTFKLGLPQLGCINLTAAGGSGGAAAAAVLQYPPRGGLALQPRLPERCWADRGVFLELAVPGADLTLAGRSTAPNNYDVVLLNVSYMCASVIPVNCFGGGAAAAVNPVGCALALMAGLSRNGTAKLPWQLPEGPAAEVVVRSGRELAVALAAAPLVSFIHLDRDVWLREADWEGLLAPSAATGGDGDGDGGGGEPVLLSRDLTVAGSPGLTSWPLLNLGFVHDKVRIGSGVTLEAHHLLTGDFRDELATQGPGMDLAAETPQNVYDKGPGLLVHNETTLLYAACFPTATWSGSLASAPRASSRPGNQTFAMGVPQDGCVGDSDDTTAPVAAASYATGGIMQPPLMSRCWASRGVFADVAVISANVDIYDKPLPMGYDIVLLNVSYLCDVQMSMECLTQHGGAPGCMAWVRKQMAGRVPPWRQAPGGQAQQQQEEAAGARENGGGGDRAATAGAIAGALGGTALLAAVGIALLLIVRRRRRQRGDQQQLQGRQGRGREAEQEAHFSSVVVPGDKPGSRELAAAAGVHGNGRKGADAAVGSYQNYWSSGTGGIPCLPLGLFRPATIAAAATATTEVAAAAAAAAPAGGTAAETTKKVSSAGAGAASDCVAGNGGGGGSGKGSASACPTPSASSGEDSREAAVRAGAAAAVLRERMGSTAGGGGDVGAAGGPAGAAVDGRGRGGGDLAGAVACAAPVSSSDGPNGSDPPTRTGDPPSSGAASGLSGTATAHRPTASPPYPSTAVLQPEDEHVVVTPLTPPRPDLALGEAAAREVTLLPVVRGKGAFGRVYEGLYGGERVAVKVMRDMGDVFGGGGEAPLDHVRSSFAQEVEVLGRCCHPNVVRLLAACLEPPKLLLVMELMETSLERLVYSKTGGLMPLRKVLYIALDIARGLEYLHPTILHRDLKPGNVLINGANSPRPVAKLTDFGVSRLRSTVLVTKHPEAGTPAYMAPETFDIKNFTLTHHVDIYSFGVVLWVLLTGSHPWRGFQMVEVAYKVTINRERLPTACIRPDRCPPRLRTLIEQCWEHEPRRRPAAAEIVKELQTLLDGLAGTDTGTSNAVLATV